MVDGAGPEALGVCTQCGRSYPVFRDGDRWHPIGTDGTCRCGGREFTVPDSELGSTDAD
jgi:hypothetical protein